MVVCPNRGRASPALGQLGDVSRLTGKLRAAGDRRRSEGGGSLLGLDMGIPGPLAIDIFCLPFRAKVSHPIPSGTVGVVPQLQLQGLVSCTPVLLNSWHRAPTLTRDALTHSAELDFGGGVQTSPSRHLPRCIRGCLRASDPLVACRRRAIEKRSVILECHGGEGPFSMCGGRRGDQTGRVETNRLRCWQTSLTSSPISGARGKVRLCRGGMSPSACMPIFLRPAGQRETSSGPAWWQAHGHVGRQGSYRDIGKRVLERAHEPRGRSGARCS